VTLRTRLDRLEQRDGPQPVRYVVGAADTGRFYLLPSGPWLTQGELEALGPHFVTKVVGEESLFDDL
jgi:hypothetical protein